MLTQLHNAHGHRTVENIARYIPSLSPEELNKEVIRFESSILDIAEEKLKHKQETGDVEGTIVAMPGAQQLLSEVRALGSQQINTGRDANPQHRAGWAIVTSGTCDLTNAATSAYAQRAFAMSGVSDAPEVFVTSDAVSKGKPDPEPYRRGAELSKVLDMAKCIVVEDAPPGVLSGKRAGARVLGLKTTHDGQRMWDNGADWVVDDLSKVHARWDRDQLVLTIDSESKP